MPVIVAAPPVEGVKTIEQDPPVRTQLTELNVPVRPLTPNLTDPEGVLEVPPALSVTVAEQLVACMIKRLAGMQVIIVNVLLMTTRTLVLPELIA